MYIYLIFIYICIYLTQYRYDDAHRRLHFCYFLSEANGIFECIHNTIFDFIYHPEFFCFISKTNGYIYS